MNTDIMAPAVLQLMPESVHTRAMREHLHVADIGVWMSLIPLAWQVARAHGIDLRELLPDSTGQRAGTRDGRQHCYGHCAPWSGSITLCLRFREKDGTWLARRSLADIDRTLAHELAHFVNRQHGGLHDRAQANILTTIQELRRGR